MAMQSSSNDGNSPNAENQECEIKRKLSVVVEDDTGVRKSKVFMHASVGSNHKSFNSNLQVSSLLKISNSDGI
jgi:FixJ family two-component response regulator